jgi:hypothetical protein
MNDYGHREYQTMNWEREYLFEDYMNLPDPLKRLELHDGRLYLRPLEYISIVELRTRTCKVLERTIGIAVREQTAGGDYDYCGPSVAFQPSGNNLWVASIGVVSASRWKDYTTADGYLSRAPELIVEIQWKERPFDVITEAYPVAVANGCEAFWVVNPEERTVLVMGDCPDLKRVTDMLALLRPWNDQTVSVASLFDVPDQAVSASTPGTND